MSVNWSTHSWCHKCWEKPKPKKAGDGKGRSWSGRGSQSSQSSWPSWRSPPVQGQTQAKTRMSPEEKAKYDESVQWTKNEIATLSKAIKALPQDSDCTPGTMQAKAGLQKELDAAKAHLRALKPLDIRVQQTEQYLGKKKERFSKVSEEIEKLSKEREDLARTISENEKVLEEMKEIADQEVAEEAEIEDEDLAKLLSILVKKGNGQIKQLAVAVQAKQRAKLEQHEVVVSDDAGEMSEDDGFGAAAGDPYWDGEGVDTRYALPVQPAQQSSPERGSAATSGGKASAKVAKIVVGTTVASTVKQTIAKLNSKKESPLGAFNRVPGGRMQSAAGSKTRARSASPALGFPRIGEDPEDY